jgi:hypothetical protein
MNLKPDKNVETVMISFYYLKLLQILDISKKSAAGSLSNLEHIINFVGLRIISIYHKE